MNEEDLAEVLGDEYFGKPIEYWNAWRRLAEVREPVFLEAIDYHEMDLNYPGVDIIERTEPKCEGGVV